jgi:hypothetical protein
MRVDDTRERCCLSGRSRSRDSCERVSGAVPIPYDQSLVGLPLVAQACI